MAHFNAPVERGGYYFCGFAAVRRKLAVGRERESFAMDGADGSGNPEIHLSQRGRSQFVSRRRALVGLKNLLRYGEFTCGAWRSLLSFFRRGFFFFFVSFFTRLFPSDSLVASNISETKESNFSINILNRIKILFTVLCGVCREEKIKLTFPRAITTP